jgi:general secretion pathway protein L
VISLRTLAGDQRVGVLADFWNWWCTELRSLRRGPESKDDVRSSDPAIHIGRDGYNLRPSGETGNLDDVMAALTRLKTSGRAKHPSINIVLGIDRSVERSLSRLQLPRSTAIAMAKLDVEAATPFKPEDVLTCLETKARGTGARRYFLVKRNVVEPLRDALQTGGFRISSIYLDTASGSIQIDLPNATKGLDWRRVATTSLAVGAACLLFVSVTNVWLRAHAANRSLQEKAALVSERLSKLKPEFQKQRQAEALLKEVQARDRDAAPTTEILHTLTVGLPDGTYLENIAIDGKSLTIAGYTNDAPPLIALLEKDALFSGVSFSAPTNKIPGKQGDRFEIGMRLGR